MGWPCTVRRACAHCRGRTDRARCGTESTGASVETSFPSPASLTPPSCPHTPPSLDAHSLPPQPCLADGHRTCPRPRGSAAGFPGNLQCLPVTRAVAPHSPPPLAQGCPSFTRTPGSFRRLGQGLPLVGLPVSQPDSLPPPHGTELSVYTSVLVATAPRCPARDLTLGATQETLIGQSSTVSPRDRTPQFPGMTPAHEPPAPLLASPRRGEGAGVCC